MRNEYAIPQKELIAIWSNYYRPQPLQIQRQ